MTTYFVTHASVGVTIISKRIKTLNYPTKRRNKLRFARSHTRIRGIISRVYVVTITRARIANAIYYSAALAHVIVIGIFFTVLSYTPITRRRTRYG